MGCVSLIDGLINPACANAIGQRSEGTRGDDVEGRVGQGLDAGVQGVQVGQRQLAGGLADEGGLFAEYLDLETTDMLEKLDPVQGVGVEINIFPSINFPEEYHLKGRIARREIRKRQLGLGVEFLA